MSAIVRTIRVIATFAAMLLVACSPSDSPSPSVTSEAAEIAWHKGTPADALALAESGNQPLFLYWGASWCPYCKQIEATVFSRRDVIDRMQQFIAVKLDGDAPSAQKLAEEYQVFGYPTMVVFTPAGEESTRVPNGLSPEAYAEVLDLALDSLKPLSNILNEILAGEEVGDKDWQRLSTYSWQQDNNRLRADRDLLETLKIVSERCPDSAALACSRLYFAYLLEQVSRAKTSPLSESSKQLAYKRLTELNDDPRLAVHNIDTILHSTPAMLGAVTDIGSPEREQLRDALQATAIRLAKDLSQSTVDRLYAAYVPIGLHKLDGGNVPERLLESLQEDVETATDRTLDPVERHAVVVTSGTVLAQAGLTDDAEQLLLNELPESGEPFYLMSLLAWIAETRGDFPGALQWRQQAYESSVGASTRFRWGYNYVMALLRMSPEDASRIETVATAMFRDIKDPATAFFGDTFSRAGNLDAALADWADSPERRDTVVRIRITVDNICEQIPDGQVVRQRCDSLFNDLES